MKIKKKFYKCKGGWYLDIYDDSVLLRELIIDYWKKRKTAYFIRNNEFGFGKIRVRYSKLPF